MAICPSCGEENPERARFCLACGTPLATSTGVRGEERRVVSVVFFDLAGFTARSEALDPEDVRAFLVPFYELVAEEAERHGGMVDKFLGDGALVAFGGSGGARGRSGAGGADGGAGAGAVAGVGSGAPGARR